MHHAKPGGGAPPPRAAARGLIWSAVLARSLAEYASQSTRYVPSLFTYDVYVSTCVYVYVGVCVCARACM